VTVPIRTRGPIQRTTEGSTILLRMVIGAYRKRLIPKRGYGQLFNRTPSGLWGGDTVRADTQVGDLSICLRDHGARQLLVFGRIMHEEAETAFVGRLAPQIRSFYDIGANYGWYARLVSNLAPTAKVVAIEANPNLVPHLMRNAPHARILHAAVTDIPGELAFHISANSALSSAQRTVGAPVAVAAIKLDDITADDAEVDFVKCDVEGGEMMVLRGSRELRSREKPPVWLLEANETFLVETGASYEALHDELSMYGPVGYYRAQSTGRIARLRHGLSDLRGTSDVNVVVVPNARADLVCDMVE
jgi:FkbM family methyltransferase